jgi:hypothetical protein
VGGLSTGCQSRSVTRWLVIDKVIIGRPAPLISKGPLRVLAPQFGGDRLFVTATRFDPDTLVSFPRVSSFFGSSMGLE